MSHINFVQSADGSVTVTTADKIPHQQFRGVYLEAMRAQDTKFDRSTKSYTLGKAGWEITRKVIEAGGLTVEEVKALPDAEAKPAGLNKTAKLLCKAIAGELSRLVAKLNDGTVTAGEFAVAKKFFEKL